MVTEQSVRATTKYRIQNIQDYSFRNYSRRDHFSFRNRNFRDCFFLPVKYRFENIVGGIYVVKYRFENIEDGIHVIKNRSFQESDSNVSLSVSVGIIVDGNRI